MAQPPCGFDQRLRIDVEHRLGVGLIAGFRIVTGEKEEITDAERGRPHQFALQRDAVFIAAGDLENRFDAGADQEARGRERAHMRPRAGPVGDVDRVGQALQSCRLLQQLLRIARHRRRKLGRHHETAAA